VPNHLVFLNVVVIGSIFSVSHNTLWVRLFPSVSNQFSVKDSTVMKTSPSNTGARFKKRRDGIRESRRTFTL